MEAQPFAIAVDRMGRRITTVLRGFWTDEIFAAYAAELTVKVAHTGWTGSRYTMLTDVSAFSIQSQTLFARFAKLLDQDRQEPHRLALVGGSGLAQMQFRRILKGDDLRLFSDLHDAIRWLDDVNSPSVDAKRGSGPATVSER